MDTRGGKIHLSNAKNRFWKKNVLTFKRKTTPKTDTTLISAASRSSAQIKPIKNFAKLQSKKLISFFK